MEAPFPQFYERHGHRLKELQRHALEEGITPNLDSEQDFLEFVSGGDLQSLRRRQAGLTLLDDGTLRVTWRNDRWRLGLRFCGGRRIEYVLLDRPNPSNGEIDSVDLESFGTICDRDGLKSLLAE